MWRGLVERALRGSTRGRTCALALAGVLALVALTAETCEPEAPPPHGAEPRPGNVSIQAYVGWACSSDHGTVVASLVTPGRATYHVSNRTKAGTLQRVGNRTLTTSNWNGHGLASVGGSQEGCGTLTCRITVIEGKKRIIVDHDDSSSTDRPVSCHWDQGYPKELA